MNTKLCLLSFIIILSFSCKEKKKLRNEYYPSGELKSRFFIFNEMKNGEYIEYFKSGKVCRKTEYINDLPHGESIRYYENGKISYKGVFIYGKPYGFFYYYNESGKIDSLNEYLLLYKDSSLFTKGDYIYDELNLDKKDIFINRQLVFDSKAEIIENKSVYLNIYLKKDTIKKEDTLNVLIDYKYPMYGKNTTYTIWIMSGKDYIHITPEKGVFKIVYDFVPEKKGINYFQGFIEESLGDKKNNVLFKKPYYVR